MNHVIQPVETGNQTNDAGEIVANSSEAKSTGRISQIPSTNPHSTFPRRLSQSLPTKDSGLTLGKGRRRLRYPGTNSKVVLQQSRVSYSYWVGLGCVRI
jgi:hypothetical protein